jgi:hypothetical protein
MRKLIAVTGISIVVALCCSGLRSSERSCYAEGPATAGTIQPASLVPPPDDPKGPSTGMVGQKLTYKTEGHDPFDVHEFQFDWGDGSPLKWKDGDKQSHVYQQEGIFSIRVREKCPLEFFTTDWSGRSQVTIAGNVATDAWQLSVRANPVAGVAIGGSAPGKTNYVAVVPKGDQVTLTAPSVATVNGTDYVFRNWVLDGVPQTEGITGLTFQVYADLEAVANYLVVGRTLSVLSDPITGVQIAGAPGGATNYSAEVPDNASVTLTAPATFDDGTSCYGFMGWAGPSGKLQTKTRQRVRVTSDMTVTAMYGMIELAVAFPNDAGIILERGQKASLEWAALNLPRGTKITVLLVKGGTQAWTLSGGANKTQLRWTVGAPLRDQEPYPDGDDYTIVVSALDGAVWAESENPFTIASVESLEISGPTSVQGGTAPVQYTCIAHHDFGGDMDVTALVKWRSTPKTYARIGKTGLLTTKPVPSEQPCTITAAYGKAKSALSGGLDTSLTP